MILRLFTFLLNLCYVFGAIGNELNWHDLKFQSINYARLGIEGGTALYSLPSNETLKFKVKFVFPNSVFTFPKSDTTEFDALSNLLVLGGTQKMTYTQIQKFIDQNGISLSTFVNEIGALTITCEALSEDFDSVVTLLEEIILKPAFHSKALGLWKQQSKNSYLNLQNMNNVQKQMFLLNVESAYLAFGSNHYLANILTRASPAAVNTVTSSKIQAIYQKILNRDGLNILLAGSYSQANEQKLIALIKKIPSHKPPMPTWLPERLNLKSSHSGALFHQPKYGPMKAAVIQKPDMTQSQISLRFYYSPSILNNLNPIERAQVAILTEVFSSTGGVVGNDRFSKAMRADSGLSYSPRAQFKEDIIFPNTNLSMFVLNFQSPNEKVFEAVDLAIKTWSNFIQNGITEHEFNNARTALMNSMLAQELTSFDKADLVFDKILKKRVPSTNPVQETLEALDTQKSLVNTNDFLKKTFAAATSTLVLIGNPSKEELEKLKKISGLDFVELKTVNSFF